MATDYWDILLSSSISLAVAYDQLHSPSRSPMQPSASIRLVIANETTSLLFLCESGRAGWMYQFWTACTKHSGLRWCNKTEFLAFLSLFSLFPAEWVGMTEREKGIKDTAPHQNTSIKQAVSLMDYFRPVHYISICWARSSELAG